MSIASLSRIAAVSSLSLLAACTQTPSTVNLDEERVSRCPLELARGQTVLINLRSNPTTGFRWQVQDAAPGVLRSLGPEVYSNPEDSGLVGSAGQSSWRFEAAQPGSTAQKHLLPLRRHRLAQIADQLVHRGLVFRGEIAVRIDLADDLAHRAFKNFDNATIVQCERCIAHRFAARNLPALLGSK